MVQSRYQNAAREQMRTAALDTAAGEVIAHGWDGLQMRVVAERVGVSRQTLYNAFTSKHGLAEALIMRLLTEFLAGIDTAVAAATTLHGRWAAVVRYSLEHAAADPLMKAVLTGTSSDEFLPLLTSDGAPVVTAARDHVAATIAAHHPDLDPHRLTRTAETITRATISHIVLPLHPADDVAEHLADLATTPPHPT